MEPNQPQQNNAYELFPKSSRAVREERILKYWKDNSIFEKSLEKSATKGDFVFFEGPPTANGRPGIHHVIARAFKDAIPRYKTMQGFYVRRKGGWDTHGLPVELQVEKALGLNSKKQVEEYGIKEFNKKCKESVWEYVDEWRELTDRSGYWVDTKNPYVTYHKEYIESLWNIVGEIHKKDLLYKDYKVLPWCPRCGTALSSHELAQGYQDDKDLSVTAMFKLVGEENTYIAAWTTTPWTLPGNVGLAVGKDIVYVKVLLEKFISPSGKTIEQSISIETTPNEITPITQGTVPTTVTLNQEYIIFAKDRIEYVQDICKKMGYALLLENAIEMKGSELVGLEYEPLYPYLQEQISGSEKDKMSNAYKVYDADFVTTTDGTGVVHTAVMYGVDDFDLGTKVGLPKFHTVDESGNFIPGTGFLEGRFVKDEDVAVDIIKDLAGRGLLFSKEKYEHSYPHCWRCGTPLIYFARDSWYIKMASLSEELQKQNEHINWEPSHIREGRFGEWISNIRDWAISRERYWGTPLPIWQKQNGEVMVIDSFEKLKSHIKKSGNKYVVMRHGQGDHNISGIVSCKVDDPVHLTDFGKQQVQSKADELISKNITRVYVSPYIRTKETADILVRHLGISSDSVVVDDRLADIDAGIYHGKTFSYTDYFNGLKSLDEGIDGGESPLDARIRIAEFLYEIDQKHSNETILIVTHGIFFEVLDGILEGYGMERSLDLLKQLVKTIMPGDTREFEFVPLPHDDNYEFDPHRPFIDDLELIDESGNPMKRVKEVMDVWFDSGAMPFAQDHYPFENKEYVESHYPADYISEGIDQTRGWFYTLLAVGVLMGKGTAYKNVTCLGLLFDANNQKMSKSKGNIVNPWEAMGKFGVDTIRFWSYSVNSPGESKNYDEKTILEVERKVFAMIDNCLNFYELFDIPVESNRVSSHVLDVWITNLLNKLVAEVTVSMDTYKLIDASRAIKDFIAELSQWYIRRSRDRFKEGITEDSKNAKATLHHVLHTLSCLIAPLAPFAAEALWTSVRTETDPESVHLSSWPSTESFDQAVLDHMEKTRDLVSALLLVRDKNSIKVRQPLGTLRTKEPIATDYQEIIKDELNIKSIEQDQSLTEAFDLDVTITEELKEEGVMKELLRYIQTIRKEKGLQFADRINLSISTDEPGKALVEKFKDFICAQAGITNLALETFDSDHVLTDNGYTFKIAIQ